MTPQAAPKMKPPEIRTLRADLGTNQHQLAQLLGVHWITVSRWERGKKDPSPYHVAMLLAFRARAKGRRVFHKVGVMLMQKGVFDVLRLLI